MRRLSFAEAGATVRSPQRHPAQGLDPARVGLADVAQLEDGASSSGASPAGAAAGSGGASLTGPYLGYVSIPRGEQTAGPPSTIYVRVATGHEASVQALLAPTANPEAPNQVNVSQPSDVLTARAAAAGAFDSLFLGLGIVALIVGAVGVANIMIISVLEHRSEIGLRRALGATKQQIRTQFLTESILLAVLGGIVGVLVGIVATAIYANAKHWAIVIPVEAWSGGIASAIVIGAFAGLMPAIRASRLPPTVALRTG
jgi:putative ABC transport system permease protein